MGSYDGSVVIQALVDATGIKKELEKLQNDTATSVGKWKVGFAAAGAAAAAAGAAAVAVGKAAIGAYADYEQLVGGVETLFKDNADVVMGYADNAYKSAGMSANAYMETVTGFSASLLQSLGGDTQKAAELGNQAVVDMADNANKMGSDIGSIQDAYQGFAKQNYTMLDNLKLGYGGTKSEMERLLADANKINASMGILTDYDINSFADITEAIHVVQESMGIAGTTAQEAEDTIQGSVAAAKGAWTNLLVGMADGTQDMDVLVRNFVDSVIIVAQNLVPRIGQVIKSLISLCWEKAPDVGKLLLDAAKDIGKNVVAGLWQGIKSRWDGLKKDVSGLIGGLVGKAKDDLDIHSPSGVFAEIGEYCTEGLAVGMRDGSDRVIKEQAALTDEIVSAAKRGAEELRKTNEEMLAEAAEIEKGYTDALSSRTNEIMGSFGLFEAAPEAKQIAVDDLLGNLREQKAAMEGWTEGIAELTARGLDEGFVQAVRDKGPNALGELLALNSMSDEQIAEYAEMWQGLNEQAGLAAAAELGGLREETDKQIAELLDGVEEVFVDETPEVGESLSEGLAEGILDGKSGVVNAAAAVAAAAVRAAKKALDINSPSRKFRYLGQMTDAGFASGIKDGIKDVQAAVGEIYQASVAITPVAAKTGGSSGAIGGISREVITNNRTVEKVARLEGDGLTDELVRMLHLRLKAEDDRLGPALGV